MTGSDQQPDASSDGRDGDASIARLVQDPDVHEPVLIVQLDGWIDAAEASRRAADAVESVCEATPIARFDDDTYIDYRARRPTLQLRDGVSTSLSWAVLELRAGRSPDGRDVLLLRGPEPDMAWRRFGRTVAGLAGEFGVSEMVGFGAYPFAAPHTRPALLSVSSPSTEVLTNVSFARSSVDVLAGAEALLERVLHEAKIPTIGLWAQVPHYAAANAYSAAAMALLEGLHSVTGVRIEDPSLVTEAEEQRGVLTEKLADSPELSSLLGHLEEMYDRAIAEDVAIRSDGEPELELRSGDELAAEIQRFLRDQP